MGNKLSTTFASQAADSPSKKFTVDEITIQSSHTFPLTLKSHGPSILLIVNNRTLCRLSKENFDFPAESLKDARSLSSLAKELISSANIGSSVQEIPKSQYVTVEWEQDLVLSYKFTTVAYTPLDLKFLHTTDFLEWEQLEKSDKMSLGEEEMKSKKLVSISPTLVSHNSDSDLWECSCSFANESRIVSDERNSQAFVGFLDYNEADGSYTPLSLFSFWVTFEDHRQKYPRRPRHAKEFSSGSDTSDIFSDPEDPSYSPSSSAIPEVRHEQWKSDTSFGGVPPATTPSSHGHERDVSTASGSNATPLSPATGLDDAELTDGPLFRATVSSLEKKTVVLKQSLKKALKQAEVYMESSRSMLQTDTDFLDSVEAIPSVDVTIRNYLRRTQDTIHRYHEQYLNQIQTLVIDPLRRIYENDVKLAEQRKKEFDNETEQFYYFLTKYLSIKSDENAKKKMESDTKYGAKRRNFDLRRFDYYTLLHELHGGQKDQEISFIFTNFAEKQYAFFHSTEQKLTEMKPELDKLGINITEATKSMHQQKKEREEKRKLLESRSHALMADMPEGMSGDMDQMNEYDQNNLTPMSPTFGGKNIKGGRDIAPHYDPEATLFGRRREGFLLVGSTHPVGGAPTPTVKPSGTPSNWKKMWCVVSHGQLQEYTNWKKQLVAPESINLRFCTVRDARNCDRRFCFELIGPHIGRRLYQAMDADDCKAWIAVIQNAIEGLLCGTSSAVHLSLDDHQGTSDGVKGDTKASPHEQHHIITTDRLLDVLRSTEPSNLMCADCGAKNPDWCSINLGCLLCIDCSGIHRSLGTHITKIRSLTLDTTSFTSEIATILRDVGNMKSNHIWEANYRSTKPGPTDRRDIKQSFIRDKYVYRRFVDASSLDDQAVAKSVIDVSERSVRATQKLIEGVAEGNMVKILHGIALGGDVNFSSSDIPPMFIVSCRFDPKNFGLGKETSNATKGARFSVAELLFQNGAVVNSVDTVAYDENRWYLRILLPGIDTSTIMQDSDIQESEFINLAKFTTLRTALHYAALFHDLEAITYLLGKGGDPYLRDATSKTPLDLVRLGSKWKKKFGLEDAEAIENALSCEARLLEI